MAHCSSPLESHQYIGIHSEDSQEKHAKRSASPSPATESSTYLTNVLVTFPFHNQDLLKYVYLPKVLSSMPSHHSILDLRLTRDLEIRLDARA